MKLLMFNVRVFAITS